VVALLRLRQRRETQEVERAAAWRTVIYDASGSTSCSPTRLAGSCSARRSPRWSSRRPRRRASRPSWGRTPDGARSSPRCSWRRRGVGGHRPLRRARQALDHRRLRETPRPCGAGGVRSVWGSVSVLVRAARSSNPGSNGPTWRSSGGCGGRSAFGASALVGTPGRSAMPNCSRALRAAAPAPTCETGPRVVRPLHHATAGERQNAPSKRMAFSASLIPVRVHPLPAWHRTTVRSLGDWCSRGNSVRGEPNLSSPRNSPVVLCGRRQVRGRCGHECDHVGVEGHIGATARGRGVCGCGRCLRRWVILGVRFGRYDVFFGDVGFGQHCIELCGVG